MPFPDIAVRADGNVCAIVLAWFSLHCTVGTHPPTVALFKLALVIHKETVIRIRGPFAPITCLNVLALMLVNWEESVVVLCNAVCASIGKSIALIKSLQVSHMATNCDRWMCTNCAVHQTWCSHKEAATRNHLTCII